jgi:hypothetical protein
MSNYDRDYDPKHDVPLSPPDTLAAAAEEAVKMNECDCNALRVQWKSLHDEREEQYAALRRRGIRFVRFGGTLEAIVPDDHADMLKSAMPEDEVKRIDGMIEGCVLSAEERENVGDSDLLDICLRAMDLRDQVQFLSKEVRQRVRVIDELTRVINKE